MGIMLGMLILQGTVEDKSQRFPKPKNICCNKKKETDIPELETRKPLWLNPWTPTCSWMDVPLRHHTSLWHHMEEALTIPPHSHGAIGVVRSV